MTVPLRTPWNGYFETLHNARVVAVDNPEQIDFDSLDWKNYDSTAPFEEG
ncbi:UNVERIFIED_ORG: hypothetical protein [Escherichia phage CMSTMSU]